MESNDVDGDLHRRTAREHARAGRARDGRRRRADGVDVVARRRRGIIRRARAASQGGRDGVERRVGRAGNRPREGRRPRRRSVGMRVRGRSPRVRQVAAGGFEGHGVRRRTLRFRGRFLARESSAPGRDASTPRRARPRRARRSGRRFRF